MRSIECAHWYFCVFNFTSPRARYTFVMAVACATYSFHSPGTVRGNLTARSRPVAVPANSMRPECDMDTLASVTSGPAGTSRRICSAPHRYQ